MTAATVVLVSPPCATTAPWGRVMPLLNEMGLVTVAVQLPSCLPESDLDDAGFLRSILDESRDVVLVGHSNGGLVLTEVGHHPAVRHLVYVDAVMWDVGEPWGTLIADGVAAGWAACVRVRRDAVEFDRDAVAAYLSSRGWPTGDIDELVAAFRPQRHAASALKLNTAAWRAVPSTFIAPDDSEMLPPLQGRFVERATEVIRMPGDHFPHWRRPADLAAIIGRIAHANAD